MIGNHNNDKTESLCNKELFVLVLGLENFERKEKNFPFFKM